MKKLKRREEIPGGVSLHSTPALNTTAEKRMDTSLNDVAIIECQDAIEEYWGQYGREIGFPTRVKSVQKRKLRDGDATYLQLVYGRQGTHKKKIVPQTEGKTIVQRNCSTIKCGCPVRMRAIHHNGNQWKVSKFEKEHNHGLVTPKKFVHMRNYRHMPQVTKSLTVAFEDQNLPVGKVASVLHGELVGFDERDCYNHLNSTKNYMLPKTDDATTTLAYFKKKSVEDPSPAKNTRSKIAHSAAKNTRSKIAPSPAKNTRF